jgi:hypothetical protein
MTTMDNWQESYRAAIEAFDPAAQKPLISKARQAIFDRLLDLCDFSDTHREEEAQLEDALRQLWIAENLAAN